MRANSVRIHAQKFSMNFSKDSCKEAASKLRGKGGVNTLSNKKCLVGRTVMIQRALHSPDIGERFTYSECMRTTHRKFSTGF